MNRGTRLASVAAAAGVAVVMLASPATADERLSPGFFFRPTSHQQSAAPSDAALLTRKDFARVLGLSPAALNIVDTGDDPGEGIVGTATYSVAPNGDLTRTRIFVTMIMEFGDGLTWQGQVSELLESEGVTVVSRTPRRVVIRSNNGGQFSVLVFVRVSRGAAVAAFATTSPDAGIEQALSEASTLAREQARRIR